MNIARYCGQIKHFKVLIKNFFSRQVKIYKFYLDKKAVDNYLLVLIQKKWYVYSRFRKIHVTTLKEKMPVGKLTF